MTLIIVCSAAVAPLIHKSFISILYTYLQSKKLNTTGDDFINVLSTAGTAQCLVGTRLYKFIKAIFASNIHH